MGFFKIHGHPGFRTSGAQPEHGENAHEKNAHSETLNDAITEVPGPGTPRQSRRKQRLSPAAVIARSLAPDAGHLSPADIIARSMHSAFGMPDHHPQLDFPIRAQNAPPPPPPPTSEPEPFADFWNVWMQHHDYLFKQSLRFMSGNMADAEDALSQAMLKGSQYFDAESIRNERAWLTRLVHNACMDQHRSHKRQARFGDEIDGDDPDQTPNVTPRPMRSPDEALTMRQTFDHLEHQLLSLPVSLLEPLLLRVVEEQSYEEIAGKMGLSNCAVRKRIQLARDRLKQANIP